MKLADLLKQAETQSHKVPVMIGDEPSGNHLMLKAIGSDETNLALTRYHRLLKLFDERFEKDNAELKAECEAAKDFGEYNIKHNIEVLKLHKAFALELVDGWDFDDEFSADTLSQLLDVMPSLAMQIRDEFYKALGEHQKK